MQQNNSWADEYDNAVDLGNFTNNFYFNPFSDVPILRRFHYNVSGVTPFLSARVVPMSFEYWQGLGEDPGSTKSPLKSKDFEIGSTSGGIAELSDDLESGDGDWIASNSECDKDGLDLSLEGGTGNALRNTDCFWIEHKSYNAFAIVDPPVGIGEIASGTYRYTFRLRSTDTDALQFCPQYAEGKYRDPQFVALTSEWKDHEFVIDVVDEHGDDYLFTSFQNVWYSLAAQGTSVIDIDNIVAQPCSLNASYPDQIAANHILHFHDPLADDPYEPLELVGCWADVRNNIYTGTVTLAPWESIVLYRLSSDFASLSLDGNGEYHITGTEVWNTNRNVQGSIVVEDGGTLIVDGAIIGFAESTGGLTTNIVVEPGGTLIVRNNGHLTSVVDCDDPVMWDGVKVLGVDDKFEMAPEQGRVFMTSGAKISNALTGILASYANPAAPGYWDDSYGGSVALVDAIFENNVHGVVLHPGPIPAVYPYTPEDEYYNGISWFHNCTFRTTRPLNDPDLYPVAHVRLTGRETATFRSCTFANDRTDLMALDNSQRMGHGIDVFDGSFTVTSCAFHCVDDGVPPNVFRNLDHGIHYAASSYGGMYLYAQNSVFENNICGVYLSGGFMPIVTNNTLTLGKWHGVDMTNPDELYWGDHHRGIFTTSTTGHMVQENMLARSAGAPGNAQTEGIVVGYTQDNNEVVYLNTASNLSRGFVGEGISADIGGTPNAIGLQFHCNENDGNATNLMSRKANGAPVLEQDLHTIRGYQGGASLSAGNSFDQNTTWDIEMTTEQLPVIRYYYSSSAADLEPINFTSVTSVREVQPYATGGGSPSTCDAGPGVWEWLMHAPLALGPARSYLNEHELSYRAIRQEYAQAMDRGSSDALMPDMLGTTSVGALRDRLMESSPFLSTEVLRQVVLHTGLPTSAKAEVLRANPEATQAQGFLKWAATEVEQPLSRELTDAVVATWREPSERGHLEERLAAAHTALTQAAYRLLHAYQMDSLRAGPDSLRTVWQRIPTIGARYAEAALLIKHARLAEAATVVEHMATERLLGGHEAAERERMGTYIAVLSAAQTDGRQAYTLNGKEVAQLEEMVADHYDRPAVWASNLLCAIYGRCRTPYTGGGGDTKSRMPETDPRPSTQHHALALHPNPANSWVAMDYTIAQTTEALQAVVRDLAGREVARVPLAGTQGRQVLQTQGLPAGVYMVELLQGGRVKQVQRLVVQP